LGKNLIGAFHFPRLVYADLTTLATLPPRERASGLGEVVKHALLCGEDFLRLLAGDEPPPYRELVLRSLRYKAQVVAQDPLEHDRDGGRALLNLGHTVGHALESTSLDSAHPLLHGEAVALGLIAAARISAHLGLSAEPLEQRITQLLQRLHLPTDLDARLSAMGDRLRDALFVDKKKGGTTIRFVALVRPGECRLVSLSVDELLPLLAEAV
jgi:3-dehydroquinate synthetase